MDFTMKAAANVVRTSLSTSCMVEEGAEAVQVGQCSGSIECEMTSGSRALEIKKVAKLSIEWLTFPMRRLP
jgi:hypothetical protein